MRSSLSFATYIFKTELVKAEFKVDDGPLVLAVRIEQVNELSADLLIQLVVGEVQAEQCGVLGQSLNHIFDTLVLLSFVTEVV